MRKLKSVTPGELLLEEFLKPLGISRYREAKEIGVPAQRIGDIVKGNRAITAELNNIRMISRIRAGLFSAGGHRGQSTWWWPIAPKKQYGLSSRFISPIWRIGSLASAGEGNH